MFTRRTGARHILVEEEELARNCWKGPGEERILPSWLGIFTGSGIPKRGR